jgi:ABC-2 type transport system ATP-binding protein
VLDEPTAGVDIELRQQLWAYVRQLNAAGTTVLLTTHYLEEAQELCDRIAIIHQGKVMAHDTTESLLAQLDSKKVILRLARGIETLPESFKQWHAELKAPDRLEIGYRPSATNVLHIVAAAQAAGLEIADLTTEESDLEDAFLALTR